MKWSWFPGNFIGVRLFHEAVLLIPLSELLRLEFASYVLLHDDHE
ncbi:MAG: hypothetical protein ACRYF4_13550 [Janthinobacterium lividum]